MFLFQRIASGLLLLALVLAASACGGQPPAQNATATPEGAAEGEAPAESEAPAEGEAPAESEAPAEGDDTAIAEIPEPGAETGVVHGLLLNAEDQQPITRDNAAADIYLAEIVYTTEDQRPFSLLDQQNSPHTIPDTRGVFVFDNVEPGEYAISVVTPLSQVVARSADNIEEDLVFTVEAGQTVDVGDIYARYP